MNNYKIEIDIRECIDVSIDGILAVIAKKCVPEDVFTKEQLESWAKKNNYKKDIAYD